MNVKRLLLLCISLFSLSARAVIISGSRWEINGKIVVLLGDYHLRTLHDKEQIALIEQYLDQKRGIQFFVEGLPVRKMNFFDFYKKQASSDLAEKFSVPQFEKSSNKGIDLGFLAHSYYEQMHEIEKEEQTLLHKISNYSSEIQQSDNLIETFLGDFNRLNRGYHLNSLMLFFNKKYYVGSPSRTVVDSRLLFDLLVSEYTEGNLGETLLKGYLERFFMQSRKRYTALLETLEKKEKEYQDLCAWYKRKCKALSRKIDVALNALENNYNFDAQHFQNIIERLFNFDCISDILNALFYGKARIVFGLFGAYHTEWMEKIFIKSGIKPQIRYEAVKTKNYKPSLYQTNGRLKKDDVQSDLILSFIHDTKNKLEKDPEHNYYYDDQEVKEVPLAVDQMKKLLPLPRGLLRIKTLHAKKELRNKLMKKNRRDILYK